jgi:protoporphyrinogen oxidase
MAKKVVIVGGGIAGMTAALTLLKQGKRESHPFDVTILEAKEVPGGQARSYAVQPRAPSGDELAGEAPFVVEHGSHVFFQFYDTILKIIDELRSDPELAPSMPALYPVPGWTIVDAYGNRALLEQGPVLPAPYSVFPSMLGVSWLPLTDRLELGIGALRVLDHSYEQFEELDRMSSQELGLASGYSALGLVGWNSASLGLTNLFIQEQSGAIFCAKHKVLLQYPNGLRYQLPAGDLNELIAKPLAKKVVKLGAKLVLGAKVTHLTRADGATSTEVAYHGKHHGAIEADHVILAVPPKVAAKLASWVSAPWTGLGPVSPVLTVVLRLSGQLESSASGNELGLSREQWAFSVITDLSRFWPIYEGLGKTVIRCEIGHADRLPYGPSTADDEVINMLRQDLERLFPEMLERGIGIEAYAIHREEQLLYTRWAKGEWGKKPKERDLGKGVYLAGDWTTKGTIGMEAAANSGIEAANHVLVGAKLPPVPFRDIPL